MVSVASLLNPLPTFLARKTDSLLADSQTGTSASVSSSSTALNSDKMPKSAAIFIKGQAKGVINYKPCETQNEKIAAEHRKFRVEPIGRIGDYPRHIPYSSEKKSFQKRTGRDAFEAYQYTFRMPGDDPQKDAHAMMWDYNVGLVRITALFKSLRHSKTMPAKVMSANPRLRDISHSITGGSIGAQGYWVPFEAAKAVAATFCWEIRYVLTPVFGLDFPDMCTDPNSPAFLRLDIDPAVIERCEEAAYVSRAQSQEVSLVADPQIPPTSKSGPQWNPKPLRPKTTDIESGYGTDSDRSPFGSPRSTDSSVWTPVNIPRSTVWGEYQSPPPAKPLVSTPPPSSTTVEFADKKRKTLKLHETDNDGYPSDISTASIAVASKRQKTTTKTDKQQLTREALAAKTLMELHRADMFTGQRVRAMSRRASS